MEKKIPIIQNFDKTTLLSNSQTISHTADKFIIDFKGTYPQFTPDTQVTYVISHKTVILDLFAVKNFIKVLQENVKKYEEKYGEIKIPEAIKKVQKEEQNITKETTTASDTPEYMG